MAIKPQPVEPARHYAPRGIAALLAPVLRPALRRRGAVMATLIEDWPAIAGPDIAARSLPVKCAAGTLTLGCAGPDALELQHMGPGLIARVNLALGGTPVERLRFTDMKQPAGQKPVPSRRVLPGSIPLPASSVTLPEGPIGEALARLRRGLSRKGSADPD
ncbi:MAG: DUF721 domain-containing protein [Acidiphilium sp.]|nr:DUF721 domain-containing protein [Acidiphilium sp.]MDD4934237.1 DUF721 domain-containing protein [Acidiphilium sp.]